MNKQFDGVKTVGYHTFNRVPQSKNTWKLQQQLKYIFNLESFKCWSAMLVK